MQKNIIALAIAAVCAAPVAAMADAIFFGSMDGGLRHQTNEGAAGTTDSMKMGQYNTSRWGFKGIDDLGDGMKANVVLETSFVPYGVGGNPDMNSAAPADFSGVNQTNNPFGLIFDRQATVGLEGGFGKADMGWNYTTSYNVISTYDPFGYKFNAIALAKGAAQQDRAGNVTYSNKMGDITLLAEYQINNAFQSRQPTTGTGRAVGLTYAAGAINAGVAYTAQEAGVAADNSNTHVTAGAGYNFGDGKVSVGYAKKATKTAAADNTATNMWVGASYNMSPKLAVTAAYYSKATNSGAAGANDATNKTTIAMLTYAMSKKTTAYFEADRKVEVAAAAGSPDVLTSGFSAGLDVKF